MFTGQGERRMARLESEHILITASTGLSEEADRTDSSYIRMGIMNDKSLDISFVDNKQSRHIV